MFHVILNANSIVNYTIQNKNGKNENSNQLKSGC